MNPSPGIVFTLPFPLFVLALVMAIALAPAILAVAPFVEGFAGKDTIR